MEQTKEWKPEKIIGGDDFKEITVPYGLTQEKLIPGIHYPKTNSESPKIGSFTFSTTGIIVITGLGFKPSLVRFSVGDNSTGLGTGAMTSTSQFSVNYAVGATYGVQCIYYGSPVRARCVYVSMDTDGFTINCIYYNPGLPTQVYYEAYP